jgi:anti-sigma factor RsiW
MNRSVETPMTFADESSEMPPLKASEEVEWLMSLALDDALDEDEAARLEWLLRQEPANMDRWTAWQAVDSAFEQAPRAVPGPDFGETFARKLVIHDRRRRLRTGVFFGLIAVVLWLSALTGLLTVGALVWTNQGEVMSSVLQNIGYWWLAVGQLVKALLNTGEALWSAPQTRALVVCYFAVAIAILSGWFIFLRRSTHELSLVEAQMVEA